MSATPTRLQIVLFTYRGTDLGDDIASAAARVARQRDDVQFVVAWGGPDDERARRWRADVLAWKADGANVRLIEHPEALHRMRVALQNPAEWILPLADDDPIGVNYLRAMAEGVAAAGLETSGLLPRHHLQAFDHDSALRRFDGWTQPVAAQRLSQLLAVPSGWGTLFWGAYRSEVVSAWLNFALELPFQASYLDQFLPHLAVFRGQLRVLEEDTFLLKDDRHWQTLSDSARTDSRYYPMPEMTLYHEWFWASDLWDLIQRNERTDQIALNMKSWSRVMIGRMLENFDHRRQVLGLQLSLNHSDAIELLRPHVNWLNSHDSPHDVAEAMDRLAWDAHTLRRSWVDALGASGRNMATVARTPAIADAMEPA